MKAREIDAELMGEAVKARVHSGPWLELDRWLLMAALIYAPWAYGSTRAWTIEVLSILLSCSIGAWMIRLVCTRRWPTVPRPLLIAVAIVLVEGWWMTFNAPYHYRLASFQFAPRDPLIGGWPGSIDYSTSWLTMLRVTTLLGTLLFVIDMAAETRWRKWLIGTLAVTGLSVVLLGLIQKLTGADAIFWGNEDTGKTFFGTYRYHSNAGAFINMLWPLLAGYLVVSIRQARPMWHRLTCASSLVLCLIALAVTGARAAGLLAFPFLLAWIIRVRFQIRRAELPPLDRSVALVGGGLLLCLVVAAAALAGLELSLSRWHGITELMSASNPRLLVDQACLKMIPEAGWFGFGPGTFAIAFPYFTNYLGDSISGRWLYAHQDYLQTLIEWDYVGGLAWAVCVVGGLTKLFRQRSPSVTTRTMTFAIGCSITVTLLHSMVDFPLQIASLQLYFITQLGLLWRPSSSESR